MSPPQLIPPTSPGQFSPGTEDSGEGFSGTGNGPFRALIASNLKWGGPCRGHYVFPAGQQTRPIHPAESFVPANLPLGGGEYKVCGCRLNPSLICGVLPSLKAQCISQSGSGLRRLYLRPQPHTTTIFPRDERLIYTSHQQGQAGLSTAGAVHRPFILTVNWLGWLCYLLTDLWNSTT